MSATLASERSVGDPQRQTQDQQRQARLGIIRTQRKPVTWTLVATACFFVALAANNLLQGDYVVAALCCVAVAVSLIFSTTIYYDRPKPFSDASLTFITLSVLAIAIDRRGLIGILWCHPLMLMFHLVADRRASKVFDAGVLLLAVSMSYVQYDTDTTFRVGVILLICSALAHIYARVVTEHQRHQEEHRQHLDLLVRCSNVGGLEWNVGTQRMTCSERLVEMLGHPQGIDLPEWNILDHIDPQDHPGLMEDFFGLIKTQGTPGQIRQALPRDFRFLLGAEKHLWVHAEAIAVADSNGGTQKFIATFLDVSQLRAAEADTLAALNRQKELNELRARFVAMTSHEFRTPLATILSSAELLRHYSERMPESERQDVLQSVEDGVQRMTVMLDRILLINKADAQMLEFQPVEIDLRALCLNMVEEVRQQYDLHQCELQTDFDIEGATGCFDEKLLRHIFINLLTNAIKYSPNGGRVVFRIRQDSVGTQFEVSDQGIGIPVSDLPELFEPFHRASNVGGIKGTGLGLTIVKKSVELHQGEISVVSEVGKGTCFKVKFIREATHGKHIGH